MKELVRKIAPRNRTEHTAIVKDLAKWLTPDSEIITPYTRADNLQPFSNAVSKHGKKMGIKLGYETKPDGSVWLQRHY